MAMNNKVNEITVAGCIALMACLFIFCLHVYFGQASMISLPLKGEITNSWISQIGLTEDILFHQTYEEFAKRPCTNYLVRVFSNIFCTTLPEAFVLVSFLIIGLNGILVFCLAKLYNHTFLQAIWSLICFFCFPSIMFCFYIPVYSYDEPLQYFLCLLTFIFFKKEKLFHVGFFALLSLITRETSVLFLFGLLVLDMLRSKTIYSKFLNSIFLAFLLYIFFQYFYTLHLGIQSTLIINFTHRFRGLFFNFCSVSRSIETIICLFVSTGLGMYLFFKTSFKRLVPAEINTTFIFVFVVNFVIIICFTKAREFRLFNLPFILLYPFIGASLVYCWDSFVINVKLIAQQKRKVLSIILVLILMSVFVIISKAVFFEFYEISIANNPKSLFKFYGATLMCLILLDVSISLRAKLIVPKKK
jgi:hypothetical protein